MSGSNDKHITAAVLGADTAGLKKDLDQASSHVKAFYAKQKAEEKAARQESKRAEESHQKQIERIQRGTARRARSTDAAFEGSSAVARGARGAAAGGGMQGGINTALGYAAGIAGAGALTAQIKKAKDFREMMIDIAIRGKMTTGEMNDFEKSILQTSDSFGIGKEQIAQYAQTIIDQTGSVDLARSSMKDLAAVAYSTNSSISALAPVVKDLNAQLKIDPKNMTEAFGILAAQADLGAMPLDKMQNVLSKVLATASAFGHEGVQAVRDYGAALQMAARTTATPEQAATSLVALMNQMMVKREALEKALGVELKTKDGWKDLGEMMKIISNRFMEIQKSGKKIKFGGKMLDAESAMAMFADREGLRALLAYTQSAKVGHGNKVGTLESLDTITQGGGGDTIRQRVNLKKNLDPEIDAWNKSVNQFKNQMHRILTPALKGIGRLIDSISPYASVILTDLAKNWKILIALFATMKVNSMIQASVASRIAASASAAGSIATQAASAAKGGSDLAGQIAAGSGSGQWSSQMRKGDMQGGLAGGQWGSTAQGKAQAKGKQGFWTKQRGVGTGGAMGMLGKVSIVAQSVMLAGALAKSIYDLIENRKEEKIQEQLANERQKAGNIKSVNAGLTAAEMVSKYKTSTEEGQALFAQKEKLGEADLSKMTPEEMQAWKAQYDTWAQKRDEYFESVKQKVGPANFADRIEKTSGAFKELYNTSADYTADKAQEKLSGMLEFLSAMKEQSVILNGYIKTLVASNQHRGINKTTQAARSTGK